MIKKETELLKKLNKKNETLYHISSVIIFCILSVLLFVLGEPYINILTESLNGKYDVKTNAYKNEKCAFIGYECSYYYEVNGERFFYKKNTFGLNPQKIKISYEEKNPSNATIYHWSSWIVAIAFPFLTVLIFTLCYSKTLIWFGNILLKKQK